MNDDVHALVLAAGEGSRMKSDVPKVCHRCFGEPMLVHGMRALERAGVDRIHVVVGEGKEDVRPLLPPLVDSVEQEEPLGTADAVREGLEGGAVPGEALLLVTCGDIPGVRPETYRDVLEHYADSSADLLVLTARVDDPADYGRVVTGEDGRVRRIVEAADASEQQRAIRRINAGILCGRARTFREGLPRLEPDNEAGEYYLTDLVEIVNEDGGRVGSFDVEDAWEVTGINTRRQLVEFEREGYRKRNRTLLEQGVTIRDPDRVKLGPWVDCERDVEIEGDVTVLGESAIGAGSRLEGPSRLRNVEVGRECEIVQSQLRESRLGNHVRVGPFAHVRPDTQVEDDVRLGNFVEIKNASVGEGTNIAHLSYIGDARIGRNVNVGAGTITCNYDGYDKHVTQIDDDTFVGSNTAFVAPVTIGEGALIGAGSTITRDVPPHSLALTRADQEIREEWVRDVWEPMKSRTSP